MTSRPGSWTHPHWARSCCLCASQLATAGTEPLSQASLLSGKSLASSPHVVSMSQGPGSASSVSRRGSAGVLGPRRSSHRRDPSPGPGAGGGGDKPGSRGCPDTRTALWGATRRDQGRGRGPGPGRGRGGSGDGGRGQESRASSGQGRSQPRAGGGAGLAARGPRRPDSTPAPEPAGTPLPGGRPRRGAPWRCVRPCSAWTGSWRCPRSSATWAAPRRSWRCQGKGPRAGAARVGPGSLRTSRLPGGAPCGGLEPLPGPETPGM